jgi:hypothetical protein
MLFAPSHWSFVAPSALDLVMTSARLQVGFAHFFSRCAEKGVFGAVNPPNR